MVVRSGDTFPFGSGAVDHWLLSYECHYFFKMGVMYTSLERSQATSGKTISLSCRTVVEWKSRHVTWSRRESADEFFSPHATVFRIGSQLGLHRVTDEQQRERAAGVKALHSMLAATTSGPCL